MVEFVIAVPIIVLFMFMVIEFSLIWRNSLTISTASQLGARSAANAANDRHADYEALSAAIDGLSSLPGDATIERIVVYKPIDADGSMHASCRTATTGVAGLCNVYEGGMLVNPPLASFGNVGDPVCAGTDVDRNYCPKGRSNTYSGGFDHVGVFVAVRHSHVTGLLFSGTRLITDRTVMQLEPKVN